jgi:benzoate-CoA ligase family protein
MVMGEQFDYAVPESFNLGSYYLDVNLEEGRGDKTAILQDDKSYSFLDLWRLTNRVGNVLRQVGVTPGDRVLLILEDSPEWMASWIATMKVGGVGTHAYTYLPRDDYEYLFDLVEPRVEVTDAMTIGRLRAALAGREDGMTVLVAGVDGAELHDGEVALDELIAAAPNQLEIAPTKGDDIAFWNFSGGTTGKPKGVPHKHRNGAIAFESFNKVLSYSPDDIVLRVPKLFFHYSRDLGFLFALRSGAAVILTQQRTTSELIFEMISKYRPTVLINVPTMMRAMIQTPEAERADLSCLRRSMSSGEMLSAALNEEWIDVFGSEVVNRFGSAESAMGYLCNRPGKVVPGSSGTVTPLAQVKLVDDDGVEVAEGETGLLMARCPPAGTHYVGEAKKSRSTFPGDDWVNTGDMFSRDEHDYFWYVGRADDMVKVSGIWVSPLEIERGLQAHEHVREAAAMGLKDEDGLIKITAFIAMVDGVEVTGETPEMLKQFCKQRLASYKFPSAIEFMDELPKTGPGKIDRLMLRTQKES